MQVLAHRGSNRTHTENTRAAFDRSIDMGFRALELDLIALRDGTVVVFHDDSLDRLFRRSDQVRDLSYDEFQAIFPDLLSLYEFVALYGRTGLDINLEIKGGIQTFKLIEPLLAYCENTIISSFDIDLIGEVHSRGWSTAALVDSADDLWYALEHYPGTRFHANYALFPLLRACQPEINKYGVYLYTVNDAQRAQYFSQYAFVRGIFTDNDRLIALDSDYLLRSRTELVEDQVTSLRKVS